MEDNKRNIAQEIIQGLEELSRGEVGRVTEVNQVVCKVCNQLKTKIESDKFPGSGGKNKKYRDETGRLWNGKVCPSCHAERTKQHIRAKRI